MKKLFVSMLLSASMFCSAAVPCALAVDLPTVSADSKEAVSLISNQLLQSEDRSMKTKKFLVKSENGNTLHIRYKNNGNAETGIFLYRSGKSGEIPVMDMTVFGEMERYYTIPNGDTGTYFFSINSAEKIDGYLTVEQTDGDKIELPFTDISNTSWYQPYVQYDYEYSLFSGTSKTSFSPNMQMTRAQMIAVLGNMYHRLTGDIIQSNILDFPDIPENAYYAMYMHWAYENKLISGYSDGKFHPDDIITREQMAVIIDKYIQTSGIAFSASQEYTPFADESQIADWAKESVKHMAEYKIMTGKKNNIFDPKGSMTRAEAATVIMNLHQNLI